MGRATRRLAMSWETRQCRPRVWVVSKLCHRTCVRSVCVPFRLGSNNAILINIIEYYSFIFLFFIFSFIMMNVNTRAIFDFSVRTFEVMFVRSIRSLDTRARSSQHTEHRAKLNNIFDEECNVIDVIRWLRWSLIECTQHTAHT